MKDIRTEYLEYLNEHDQMPGYEEATTWLCSICAKPTGADSYCDCILPGGTRIQAPLCMMCMKLVHLDSVMGNDLKLRCAFCKKVTILRNCLLDACSDSPTGDHKILFCVERYRRIERSTIAETNSAPTSCARCGGSVSPRMIRRLPGVSLQKRDMLLSICPRCDLKCGQEWLGIAREEEE